MANALGAIVDTAVAELEDALVLDTSELDARAGSIPVSRKVNFSTNTLSGDSHMAFSDTTKDQAFRRSGGRCENCGTSVTRHGAEYHHKHSVAAGGHDGLSNCQVLCVSCHRNTRTYGKH